MDKEESFAKEKFQFNIVCYYNKNKMNLNVALNFTPFVGHWKKIIAS